MKIKKLEVESYILGKNVLHVDKITDGMTFLNDEASIISKYKPFYIQCILDAYDLSAIHTMEDAGFRFVEFRFKKMLDINSFHNFNELAFYPYIIQQITEKPDFTKAQNLIKKNNSDDRFSRDPFISGELSQNRLKAYLKKSFDNHPKEFIYGLYNKNSSELLAIKSGEMINSKEVFFYHTALKKKQDIEKTNFMIDALLISQLIGRGVKVFYSVTSGFNRMEMDLSLADLKYKIESTSVILRKIYQ